MPRVTVHVMLKPGLLDTQGRTIEDALHSIGFSGASGVRVGKRIELDFAGSIEEARTQAALMCDRLLANPVMESYRIEVEQG
jgi:phosphoribosylformylglycinamidine synthase subunit PurS